MAENKQAFCYDQNPCVKILPNKTDFRGNEINRRDRRDVVVGSIK